MIVRSLELENFKRFRSLRLELEQGLNVVKGPNESGKTTLMQALMALLYWKPDSKRQEVKECCSWGAGDGFALSAVFESSGGSWMLAKDFSRHIALLERGGERVRDLSSIDSWIAEQTGLPIEDLYRSTACIGHDDVAMLNGRKKELEDGLQASVTGGKTGISASRVIASMERDRGELEKGTDRPAKKPGPLARKLAQLDALEKEIRELELRVEEQRRNRRREKELKEEAEKLQDELVALERTQESFQERQDLERELAELKERHSDILPLLEAMEKRDSLVRERRERFGELERALRERGDRLELAAARRRNLQESLAQLEEERERLVLPPSTPFEYRMTSQGGQLVPARLTFLRRDGPPTNILPAKFGEERYPLGAALVLGGIAGAFLRPWLAFLMALGAALLVVAVRDRRAREAEARELAAATLEKRAEEIRIELSSLERSEKELIDRIGAASVENFQEIRQSYLNLVEEQRNLENALDRMARGQTREQVESKVRELITSIQVKERLLRERQREGVGPVHDQQARVRSEKLRSRLKEIGDELVRLRVELERGSGEEERLLELEEQKASLAEEVQSLRETVQAYKLAEEWMKEARSAVVRTVKERVQERVGALVAGITGGRYTRVRMDDDFKLYAHSPEKGDEVPVERLSRGTVDQVYLSARLALLESICGERRPPLLLDDPFVTFDRGRIERSLSILRDFAREHQVILFTCSDNYDAAADRVIDLSA